MSQSQQPPPQVGSVEMDSVRRLHLFMCMCMCMWGVLRICWPFYSYLLSSSPPVFIPVLSVYFLLSLLRSSTIMIFIASIPSYILLSLPQAHAQQW